MTVKLFKVYMSDDAGVPVLDTLYSGYLTQGPRVEEFEKAVGDFLGIVDTENYPIAVNSCTSALDLAFHLAGVGGRNSFEQEVVTTPMTCTATNTMLVNRGVRIRWADIDPVTGNIDIDDAVLQVGQDTKAVIVVDWGGRVVDVPMLKRLLKARGYGHVPVIRDAAHSFGARGVQNADYVTWSFQAIKHLTTGDGGALLVPKKERERARLLRWYGLDRDKSESFRCNQRITEAGYKYNMNDLSAAIGLANLKSIQWVLTRHRTNAFWYNTHLSNLKNVVLPPMESTDPHDNAWWLYTILVSDRDAFMKFMKERDIEVSPVHARNDIHPAFEKRSASNRKLPGVDAFAEHEVAIPVGWWLAVDEIEHVTQAVIDWDKTLNARWDMPKKGARLRTLINPNLKAGWL